MFDKQDRTLALAASAGFAFGAMSFYLLSIRRMASSRRLTTSSSMRLENKKSPQQNWEPSQSQHPPHKVLINSMKPSDLKSPYFFGVSAVVPRPIALISTISSVGVPNLAPFSYFGIMGHDPLTLAFSPCGGRQGTDKDTLVNLKNNGECVVHIISEWYVESANHTCGNFDSDVNEFEVAKLSRLPSLLVSPPRVAESAIQLECKLVNLLPIKNATGKTTSTICVCEVVMVHVHDEVFDKESGTVKPEKLRPVSRLGGNTYGLTREMFDILRPGTEGATRNKEMKDLAAKK